MLTERVMENDRDERGEQGKKVQFIGRRDHFIFPSRSPASLTVASHFLLHCVDCWRYVQEVGSLFPFSFLLREECVWILGGRDNTCCVCELPGRSFRLGNTQQQSLRLHFKQRESMTLTDAQMGGGWYLILNIQTSNTGTHADSHMQNIKSHLIRHLILADELINFMTHQGTEYKSSMAGAQLQHMSCQPTLFTTLYWFTPTQWPLQMWSTFFLFFWLEISHPSFT